MKLLHYFKRYMIEHLVKAGGAGRNATGDTVSVFHICTPGSGLSALLSCISLTVLFRWVCCRQFSWPQPTTCSIPLIPAKLLRSHEAHPVSAYERRHLHLHRNQFPHIQIRHHRTAWPLQRSLSETALCPRETAWKTQLNCMSICSYNTIVLAINSCKLFSNSIHISQLDNNMAKSVDRCVSKGASPNQRLIDSHARYFAPVSHQHRFISTQTRIWLEMRSSSNVFYFLFFPLFSFFCVKIKEK